MIREARPADDAGISGVNTLAFGQEAEARLVEALRRDGDVIVELVWEQEGVIDGHILFSRLRTDRDGVFAALAPMAVRPGQQRGGVGSALVAAGLEWLREHGTHGVLVLGHRAYYPRFGFAAATAARVQAAYAGSPSFMALELKPGAFAEPIAVDYPAAFSAMA